MAFRFPQIKHQIYPKTFLKDVHIVFEYGKVNPTDEKVARVCSFYENHFGLEIDDIDRTKGNGISVFSGDDTVRFSFDWDSCALIMRTPAYKSFGFAKPLLEIILEYFSLIGVNDVKGVLMWKYNELKYELDGVGNASMVLKGVFSDVLLNENMTDDDIKAMRSLTRWEKTVDFDDVDDKGSLLTFEFGFKSEKPDQLKGVVALKTMIMSSADAVAVSSLDGLLNSFNSTLDDAFHWCVKNEIINEMKKEL